jgi:hypothetical protein
VDQKGRKREKKPPPPPPPAPLNLIISRADKNNQHYFVSDKRFRIRYI